MTTEILVTSFFALIPFVGEPKQVSCVEGGYPMGEYDFLLQGVEENEELGIGTEYFLRNIYESDGRSRMFDSIGKIYKDKTFDRFVLFETVSEFEYFYQLFLVMGNEETAEVYYAMAKTKPFRWEARVSIEDAKKDNFKLNFIDKFQREYSGYKKCEALAEAIRNLDRSTVGKVKNLSKLYVSHDHSGLFKAKAPKGEIVNTFLVRNLGAVEAKFDPEDEDSPSLKKQHPEWERLVLALREFRDLVPVRKIIRKDG